MPYNELVTNNSSSGAGVVSANFHSGDKKVFMIEKEYYKQEIIKKINKIDRIDILIYINNLIENIMNRSLIK